MRVTLVLAGLAVADVDAALAWYQRLFGRPADELPMDGLAEWHFPESGAIQVDEDAERAGRSRLTLNVADLKQELAALRERGLDAAPMDEDPKGSTITIVEQGYPLAIRSHPTPCWRSRGLGAPRWPASECSGQLGVRCAAATSYVRASRNENTATSPPRMTGSTSETMIRVPGRCPELRAFRRNGAQLTARSTA